MSIGRLYIRNDDNADIYVSVYDELAKSALLSDAFLSDGDTVAVDIALSENEGIISWECYRREDEGKSGGDSNLSVSDGETIEVSTD